MLPALPTGIARTSGARPRSSQISNAAVFWPSSRSGLTEFTSVTGWSSCSARAADDAEGVVEVAVDRDDPRAGDERLEELADRDLALGRTTTTSSPAAAPYAAADAEVLPVEAQMIAPGAVLEGLRDRDDHAPILERAGRVLALDLDVEVRQAEPRPRGGGGGRAA